MRIICNKCGRKMNIGELAPHLIRYFTKILAPIVAPILIKALEHYWSLPTRSYLDDSMAALANISETKCPVCKENTCWNPDPEIDDSQKQIEKENVIIKS